MLTTIILIGITLIIIPYMLEHYNKLHGVHQKIDIMSEDDGFIKLITTIKHKGLTLEVWCDIVLSKDIDDFVVERNKEAKEYYANYKRINS